MSPPTHRQARPPSGTKERKLRLRDSVLGPLLGKISESDDFITDLFDSLPAEIRRRVYRERYMRGDYSRLRLPDKLAVLYRHWDDVDVGEAVRNVIESQLQDLVIGKVSKRFAKAWVDAFEQLGLTAPPVTPLFGLRQRQYISDRAKYYGEEYARNRRDQDNGLQAQTLRRRPVTAENALFYR